MYKDCLIQVKTVPTETENTHTTQSKITRMVCKSLYMYMYIVYHECNKTLKQSTFSLIVCLCKARIGVCDPEPKEVSPGQYSHGSMSQWRCTSFTQRNIVCSLFYTKYS